MSGVCKACQVKLEPYEYKINEDTGELEDLCTHCLSIVQMSLDDLPEEAMMSDEYFKGVDSMSVSPIDLEGAWDE